MDSVAADFVIGLGSNLGERLETLRAAVQRLDATPGVRVLARSSVYESEPLGPPQPRYLNAAVALSSALPARELLAQLLAIEGALGRVRRERWGPRVLDLDILWARTPVDEPGLTVPHPELPRRWFALLPLLEVAPELASRYGAALAEHGQTPPPHGAL